MRVAVLGGGLQGCCTALALADRGVDVVLFDSNGGLLSRTAVANEGKIHLGYMYAADPSFETARTMMEGALAFAPFMERHLGMPIDGHATSVPAAYVVHRDSQHDVDEVSHYLARVHAWCRRRRPDAKRSYFGADLSEPPRRWSDDECKAASTRPLRSRIRHAGGRHQSGRAGGGDPRAYLGRRRASKSGLRRRSVGGTRDTTGSTSSATTDRATRSGDIRSRGERAMGRPAGARRNAGLKPRRPGSTG